MEGKTLSAGLAKGVAVVVGYELQRTFTSTKAGAPDSIRKADVHAECQRMDGALEDSKRDLNTFTTAAGDRPSLAEAVELVSAHASMASEIAESVKDHISSNLVSVEDALASVVSQWVCRMQKIDNDYLRIREMDVRDVGLRMMRHLRGAALTSETDVPSGAIVVARELMPSDAIALANSGIAAIVTELGGNLGHTAIIARSLGIPAVSGIKNVTQLIVSGVTLLVDGDAGIVTAEPTKAAETEHETRMACAVERSNQAKTRDARPCRTRDGTEISLFGNVGLQAEIDQVLDQGLAGVGLYRTEFLYLRSTTRPDANSQQTIYADMSQRLAGRTLVIRTFDFGGEKLPPFLSLDPHIAASSMNLRGLRFSLVERHLLREQLLAIVQVAQTVDVRTLFPMVIGSHDFTQAIAVVDEVIEQCGVFKRPKIGAMIETPAALFCLDEILKLADFVVIGTNDLTQYLLAADRELSADNDWVTALHPAVLRAIDQVVIAAARWNRPVCVCGEEAGDAEFAELLIGMGVRELSVSPSRARQLRAAIGNVDLAVASDLAKRAQRCQSPQEVRELLSQAGRRELLDAREQPLSRMIGTTP